MRHRLRKADDGPDKDDSASEEASVSRPNRTSQSGSGRGGNKGRCGRGTSKPKSGSRLCPICNEAGGGLMVCTVGRVHHEAFEQLENALACADEQSHPCLCFHDD